MSLKISETRTGGPVFLQSGSVWFRFIYQFLRLNLQTLVVARVKMHVDHVLEAWAMERCISMVIIINPETGLEKVDLISEKVFQEFFVCLLCLHVYMLYI